MSDEGTTPNDGRTSEGPPTNHAEEPTVTAPAPAPAPTNRDREFYFSNDLTPPWSGTWIEAQAILGVARLGSKPWKSEEEEKESGDPQLNAVEDDEVKPCEREILNPEEVERSAQLVDDVINNNNHPYADLELSNEPPERAISTRKDPHWSTVGVENVKASPLEIAKQAYEFMMKFVPMNEDGTPNYDGVCCQSFSTNANDKDKEGCGCVVCLQNLMRNDRLVLSRGDPNDETARRIYQARWISFFENLIKKVQMITQHPYEEESLFSFLHVAFPYPNPAQQNKAPHYVFEDKISGMKLKSCFYLIVYILGHHYNFPRAKQFQGRFLSGQKHKGQRGYYYVSKVVVRNGRNVKLLLPMVDICIEKGKMLDFTPVKTCVKGNVSLASFLKYLTDKGVEFGSYSTDDHDKYLAPYFGKLRKVFMDLVNQGILLVAHPSLAEHDTLPISKAKAKILLNLKGVRTCEDVYHFASVAVVEMREAPLLDAIYEGFVHNAGHSGRKNLILPEPFAWRNAVENEAERARKDHKNALKRIGRQKKNQAKKQKRGSHEPVPLMSIDEYLSPEKTKPPENPTAFFLTPNPACSSIMEHLGELSKENCWEMGLASLGVTPTDKLRTACKLAHEIEVCNALLPAAKRGMEKYEVYSRFSLTMNYRDTNDEWYTVEAPHMDISPRTVADLNRDGIFPFIGYAPLQKEGNFMRVHPKWENHNPATPEGQLIFSPLGSLVIMPASTVYGCGMRTGNGGNPCVKVHYFLKEKTAEESQGTTVTATNRMLDALHFYHAHPAEMEDGFPKHPTHKTAKGDYTVHFMTMDYLKNLIDDVVVKGKKKKSTDADQGKKKSQPMPTMEKKL